MKSGSVIWGCTNRPKAPEGFKTIHATEKRHVHTKLEIPRTANVRSTIAQCGMLLIVSFQMAGHVNHIHRSNLKTCFGVIPGLMSRSVLRVLAVVWAENRS